MKCASLVRTLSMSSSFIMDMLVKSVNEILGLSAKRVRSSKELRNRSSVTVSTRMNGECMRRFANNRASVGRVRRKSNVRVSSRTKLEVQTRPVDCFDRSKHSTARRCSGSSRFARAIQPQVSTNSFTRGNPRRVRRQYPTTGCCQQTCRSLQKRDHARRRESLSFFATSRR